MNQFLKISSLLFIASMQLTQLTNASNGFRAVRYAQSQREQSEQNGNNITAIRNPIIPSNIVLPPLINGASQRSSVQLTQSINASGFQAARAAQFQNNNPDKIMSIKEILAAGRAETIATAEETAPLIPDQNNSTQEASNNTPTLSRYKRLSAEARFRFDQFCNPDAVMMELFYPNRTAARRENIKKRVAEIKGRIDQSNQEEDKKQLSYPRRHQINIIKGITTSEVEMAIDEAVKGVRQLTKTAIKAKNTQENCFVQK